MNILLSGYFDKNLGDDAMQRLVVSSFPEHKFYVNFNQQEMLTHLEEFENVCINKPCADVDLFLNVIGTGFMYKGKRAKAEKLISMLTQKPKKYPRSALLNCSLESFDSALAQRFANSDLSKYDFITCRDSKSYEYLSKNIKSARVEKYPDMVFSAGYLPQKNISEPVLGVAPVRRMYSGDNFNYYLALAGACDEFVETKKGRVKLFAFDNGLENDASAAFSVKGMMKNSAYADVIVYSGNPDAVATEISGCTFFIGSRFHSIVIASSMNVKCMAVYDTQKLEILCAEYKIPMVSKAQFNPQIADKLLYSAENVNVTAKDADGHIKSLREFINS